MVNTHGQEILAKLLDQHVDTVEVRGGKDLPCGHQRWAGKVLKVNDDGSGEPTLADAVDDGLLGEGCQHEIIVLVDLS